jgi:nicotinamidase-related amidase
MPGRSALLLIDFQHDFLARDGRMPIASDQLEPLIAGANRAIAEARSRGIPIVAVGNEFDPNDRIMNVLRRGAAIAGTPGAAWDPRVPTDGARYFPKTRGDAFSNDAFRRHLVDELGVDDVLLAGVYAKACIAATARGARRAGLRVTVLEDAVADASDALKANALRKLAAVPGISVARA